MIPRIDFKRPKSINDMYHFDETTYRRWDSSKEAFIVISQQDTGKAELMGFSHKMFANAFKNIRASLPS